MSANSSENVSEPRLTLQQWQELYEQRSRVHVLEKHMKGVQNRSGNVLVSNEIQETPTKLNGQKILQSLIASIEASSTATQKPFEIDWDNQHNIIENPDSARSTEDLTLLRRYELEKRHHLPVNFLHLMFSYIPLHSLSSFFLIFLTLLMALINVLFISANFLAEGLPFLYYYIFNQPLKIDIHIPVPYTTNATITILSGSTLDYTSIKLGKTFPLPVLVTLIEIFLLLVTPIGHVISHRNVLRLYPDIYTFYEVCHVASRVSAFRLVLFLNTEYVMSWIGKAIADSRAVYNSFYRDWKKSTDQKSEDEADSFEKRKELDSTTTNERNDRERLKSRIKKFFLFLIVSVAVICGIAGFALKLQQIRLIPNNAPWETTWSIRQYLSVLGLIINVAGIWPHIDVFEKLEFVGIDPVLFAAEYALWAENSVGKNTKKRKRKGWWERKFGRAVWKFLVFKIGTTGEDLQNSLANAVKKCRN
ncbi:hypothetical protein HK098_001416 [Nowakowskiella sp. JEL0407]|nr:hypothetical protein HK098_001416 [Nowakowskiella sp. JEL0407]